MCKKLGETYKEKHLQIGESNSKVGKFEIYSSAADWHKSTVLRIYSN